MICVFFGSPINKEAICNAFGKVILGKSTNFLKVDVTPEFNQLALKRWRSPFPKVMRISSFLDHGMQEYNPTNLIQIDKRRVTDSKGHVSKAVELSEKVGSANIKIPKDQDNVHGRHCTTSTETRLIFFLNLVTLWKDYYKIMISCIVLFA